MQPLESGATKIGRHSTTIILYYCTVAVLLFDRYLKVLNLAVAHPYTADAAIAEGSQRVLAQINARMETQRRGRGISCGSGVLGAWENGADGSSNNNNSQHVNGGAEAAITQDRIRQLAEEHGIVVRFINEGHASGEAQLRALARLHGIRIQILGHDGGVACSNEEEMGVESAALGEAGGEIALADAGGDGVRFTVTPPPVLESLRPRNFVARSSSTVAQSGGLKLLENGGRVRSSGYSSSVAPRGVNIAVEVDEYSRLCARHVHFGCASCEQVALP